MGRRSFPGSLPPQMLLLLAFSLSCCCCCYASGSADAGSVADLAALLAFKSAITGDPLRAMATWGNHTLGYCRWAGVICGDRLRPQRVTTIDLESMNLAGSLPPSLANLTFIQGIFLQNNRLSGGIPAELSRLRQLQALVLSNNALSGNIPANLSNCNGLQFLLLDSNTLEGGIPPELSSLANLLRLELYDNNLTGSIPASLANLSSLLYLDLSGNSLWGSLPESLGQLADLMLLQLSINALSGELRPSLLNFSNVVQYDVGINQLSGELPRITGPGLPTAIKFYLDSNQFSGPIPASLSNATSLQRIGIEENQFSGTVPPQLASLGNLSWLALGNNLLEAREAEDWEFLSKLTNCSKLQVLEFSNNLLGGLLPSSIANLSTQLQWLSMENNHISGNIPEGMGRYANLTVMLMFNNILNGSIPASLGSMQSLVRLQLSGNRLSGGIPESLGNLTELLELDLGGNGLQGSIPPRLGGLRNLNALNLSSNKLSGSLPDEIVSISSLSKYVDISLNSLSGTLPAEVRSLINLLVFNLSGNRFTGEIPIELGECQLLEYLLMDGNLFNGAVPASFSSLKGLQELDLSSNNLTGRIPEFLGDLRSLHSLNLSFNNLEGEVPDAGIFRNLSASSLVGNKELCGGSPSLHLQECPTSGRRRRRHLTPAAEAAIIVTSIASFVALMVLGSWAFCWRKKKVPAVSVDAASPILGNAWNVSYAELSNATDGFSPANLIGVGGFGSVYRGTMEDHKPVAVKVLNLEQQGAVRSFLAECEVLRNTRHRNLVRILTCCDSSDFIGRSFKALVFEFMPNGSLDKWLHPGREDTAKSFRKLGFVERLNIAVDVASALSYLHHQVDPPIAHCDLKPSNVLLDADMVAHVGDFGMAKFLPGAGRTPSTNKTSDALKGTIGYIAPEYGMDGRATASGDVFSYGILLLELITGKRPTEDVFKDGWNLPRYAKAAFPDHVVDIVDPDLRLDEVMASDEAIDKDIRMLPGTAYGIAIECLTSVVRVAISCTEESPRRKSMAEIEKELLEARDLFLKEREGVLENKLGYDKQQGD